MALLVRREIESLFPLLYYKQKSGNERTFFELG